MPTASPQAQGLTPLTSPAAPLRLGNEHWWYLPERDVVPAKVLERIDEHVKAMTPILNSCAEK
jgi:hypothetical protein